MYLTAQPTLTLLSAPESGKVGLDSETKDFIAALSTSRNRLDIPEFLKTHWNDFVNWRYVMEGRLVDSNPPEFDRVLEVLIATFENDS